MSRARLALSLVFLAAPAVAAYLPGLPGALVYDDQRLSVDSIDNEGLKRPFDAQRAFGRDSCASDDDRGGLGYYRPVAILLNEFDFRRQGGGPAAFHTTSLVLHAAATVLVFLLASRLFAGRAALALVAGLVFAMHPSHAESVALVPSRQARQLNPELKLARLSLAESTLHLDNPCEAERILAALVFEDRQAAGARERLFESARRACAVSGQH